MPALAFGLKSNRSSNLSAKQPVKRKAAFEAQDEEGEEDDGAFGALAKSKPKAKLQLKPIESDSDERPRKSPKLEDSGTAASRYSNLSAIRSAKLQDAEASKVDATVYDYDAVYETFNADKQKKDANAEDGGVPKYMTNLLASAEVRKRDQLRAKEKALQKERDAEGDEFADKDKFVTAAYKKQQEENRRIEEEERQREEAEEERRRKGGGMAAFHKDLLKKDEERLKAVEEAAKLAQTKQTDTDADVGLEEKPDAKVAAELNEKGAHIVMNDDGEIIDKRQLLSAGLNVAPKKTATDKKDSKSTAPKSQEWQRSSKQQDARLSQRERQSRMMERQIEETEAKQREADAAEQQALEERNKSKLTDNDKLSAKERYLQRKREREEEAAKQAKTS